MREMRRSERKLNKEAAVEILKKSEYGILSTSDEKGQPYGVPVSYAFMDEAVYFHSAIEGHKLDNIKGNDRVSFTVVGNVRALPEKFTTEYESTIVFGRAAEVFGDEKYRAFLAILDKYSKEYVEKGKEYAKNADSRVKIIKITPEHISGKANK